MHFWILVKRSLQFYARSHIGTIAGAIVASAVLVGALAVGDSVRGSLRQMALSRLGSVEFALVANDRIFRSSLSENLQGSVEREVAAAMVVLGTASSDGGAARANRVNVLGVEDDFWSLALQPEAIGAIESGQVVLNEPLASQLGVAIGDSVLFRVPKPSNLSRDAPLSPEEDTSVAMRLTVQRIISDVAFGRFSLHASQVPPFNAFVGRSYLQGRIEQEDGANLLLVGPGDEAIDSESLMTSLRQHWTLPDAQLELRELSNGSDLELRSSRVFLDEVIVNSVNSVEPEAMGVMTYFVNSLEVGDRLNPYSMVTATTHPWVPADLADDEIILNEWLADDLEAKPGDLLTMKYFGVGIGRELLDEEAQFTVKSVVPLSGVYADPDLMPDFPGLKDAENCRDWDTGFPIDLDSIRDGDNTYWEEHRGTPKAFVSANAGAKMWNNRFGTLTAMRFDQARANAAALSSKLAAAISPESLGLSFYPVREEAMRSVNQAQDFGGLFIGFSFFLILAALILMSLLFQFSMEQRSKEAGVLLALGLRPHLVKKFFYYEGGALACVGAVLGALAGVAYARAMLYGLTTIWSSAIGTSAIQFHFKPSTLLGGALGGMLVAWFTIWLGARKYAARPARELLQGVGDWDSGDGGVNQNAGRRLVIAVVLLLLALGLVGTALSSSGQNAAGLFFGAGGLLLISGMMAASWLIRRWAGSDSRAALSIVAMGIRGSSRRIKRSVATIGLLACGSFLVVSVGANKLDAVKGAMERRAGTGGFLFWGQTTQAVTQDLNSEAGREFFLLDDESLEAVQFVPFRVLPGEDASCLNLNRAQRPRLMGVNPAELAYRKAFTFASVDRTQSDAANPWLLLNDQREDGAVPAIADQNSMLWAMGKKLGDTIPYTDGKGETFDVVLVGGLANSILQGNLVIAESQFIERFPHESGYQIFLIDGPIALQGDIATNLSRAFQDVGLELVSTVQRLSDFNAVQNTYLSTFQMLGGLGLLLGSIGLGVVVLRNVWERRGEMALLKAVGFRPGALRWLVLSEHAALLIIGLLIGVGAAMIAVIPALVSPGADIPYASLGWTLFAVLTSGLVWTWIAARTSLRGHLLDALRNE
jgi:putative ABC transport system permease protein